MKVRIDERFLSSQFDRLNDLYFKGEVPRPLAFMTFGSKRFFGQCIWYDYGHSQWFYVIRISDYYERTRKGVINTLLHEMVHAYLREKGMDYMSHGHDFLTEAERLNRFGYSINPTDESHSLLADKPQVRNLIFANTKSGTTFVIAYAKNRETYYRNFFERHSNRYVKTHWVTAKTRMYADLPNCRSKLIGRTISKQAYGKLKQ